MFTLSYLLIALAILASLQGANARPAGLRRRCRVNPSASSGNGAVNVGGTPTLQPQPSQSAPAPSHSAAPAAPAPPKQNGCFPSAGFNTPDGTPKTSLDEWWCSRSSEYAFMGFSYGVDGCPSQSQMTSDFKQMANDYGARYVRIYASCDNNGFNDDMVAAAYEAGMGIFALAWFGFDGTDAWKGRLADIVSTLDNNPLAPYVIRNIAIGEEALFDNDLSGSELAAQIQSTQAQVSKYGVQVTTSDMAYKWQANQDVVDAAAHIESNTLPFFANTATTGSAAWGFVQGDLNTYQNIAQGKKVYLTQTGWPSNQDVWPANSPSAVASVGSEEDYYQLLDSKCSTFKSYPNGGAGWFAHIWSDDDLPGWGITSGGQPKFNFNARSHC